MYISPNPFIIPDDEGVIIKNFPAGATIKILTISGFLIKEFYLPINQSQIIWDGTDNQGKSVGTAIYLVGANHPTEKNRMSKIAILNANYLKKKLEKEYDIPYSKGTMHEFVISDSIQKDKNRHY